MATILISDDNPVRRRYLASMLTQRQHQVLEAESGEQAMAHIRTSSPDLVLIDVQMPNPGGYQLIRQMRKEATLSLPRILLLAAPHMESETRLLAEAWGNSRVIADVSNAEGLFKEVDAALSESPPPKEDVPGAASAENSLYPMVTRLYSRVSELEAFTARLERKTALGAAQLKVARSALDQEILKRLWTEQNLTQENNPLRSSAMRDVLTGLYNRRYLDEWLSREESRAKRSGQPLGIMMIDIDHFKRCNDSYGHSAGDAVLCKFAGFMKSQTRSDDVLCRYGGEEFVLVMTNAGFPLLRQRAEELHTGAPKLRVEFEQHLIGPITLSIGLAVFPDCGDSAKAVLQASDAALYKAKTEGRDRIVASEVM